MREPAEHGVFSSRGRGHRNSLPCRLYCTQPRAATVISPSTRPPRTADQPVVQVRHDAGVVGQDPDALADREGLARLDRDHAVLLGEPREPAAAAEDRGRGPPARGRSGSVERVFEPASTTARSGRGRADDGRDDRHGAVLEPAAPELHLREVVVDVGARAASR